MSLNHPTQIEISTQMWVCDSCGCKDSKSCGCNSTAHAEELAAKKEAHRQANREHMQRKRQENQGSVDNPRDVETTDEFDEDDPAVEAEHQQGLRVNAARGLVFRAKEARDGAALNNLKAEDVTELMVDAADEAAAAWSRTAQQLRRMIQ